MTPRAEPSNGERPWFSHYPPNVPHTLDVPRIRLSALLEEASQKWPQRTAFLFYGSRISYARLWELTGRFAASLARDGFVAGDRLALFLPNCPAYPIAFFGALRLGVTVVQVSPLYLGQDLVGLLKDSDPKGIVTLELLYPELEKVAREVSLPVEYVARLKEFYPWYLRPLVPMMMRRQGRSTVVPHGPRVRSFRSTLTGTATFPAPPPDPGDDVAVLQYTGGTTGEAKGAMLTHRNLVANALQCRAWFSTQAPGTGVVLAAIPLFHVYGMTVAMNYPISVGSTIILQLRPEPTEVLALINRYHPTELPGVPALYQAIIHHPNLDRYHVRSIKVCVSGSAPLPLEVARQFETLTGGYLIEGYGLTEASPVTHANPIEGERRPGSIGLPLPLTDQKVVDLETGQNSLSTGETGELAVRGPQVMLGYYRQSEESARVKRDGWLLTGDIARLDRDGYAFIVDRKKDMIDIGGFKVYPREVEEVLFQMPAVKEAAVVGLPEPRLGEVVHAVVVLKPGASATQEEIIAFVRERIAHYKAPRTVEFRSTLPRSGIQKVLRRVLRDEATAAATLPATDLGR
jgi:long-chain acyl-CoA synthetase